MGTTANGLGEGGTGPTLVVICWDGNGAPLPYVAQDAQPAFRRVIFDFSGRSASADHLLSHKCMGKGEVLEQVYRWASRLATKPEFVAIIDHDIEISISQINRIIEVGKREGLHSFAPALSQDSYYSFRHLLARSEGGIREVNYVEIMFPFYRYELFEYCARHFGGTITAYGIDEFGIPAAQQILSLPRTAVLDDIIVRHLNPVASHKRCYASGHSAYQERALTRRRVMDRIALERADLVGSKWYFDTFARWNGPALFLLTRCVAPFHALRRLVRNGRSNTVIVEGRPQL